MLLAHNGVSHQKKETSKTGDRSQQQVNKSQNSTDKADVQHNKVESQPQSDREVEQVQTPTETEPPTKTTTIQQSAIANESSISKFIPGWGESVFILLVISPFLLLGIKRQLHR